ncbi:hypothetical protein [Streptomyces sp900116325]|uniref:hypothetical protein n=1 Tax=Streptomyces sp. 900116325 TaxID=3154295 RepID=UPI0033ADB404
MVGIEPQLSDAELATLAMVQAVLGFTCEALVAARLAPACGTCFPVCPGSQAATGACVRPRGSPRRITRVLATGTTLWSDRVWVVGSVPVECGGSRETVNRSGLAGYVQFG